MMNVDQIFQAIQCLSFPERRGLLERLTRDVGGATPVREPRAAQQELDLVGFLADDPEVADEIYKIATVEREGEDMRTWNDEAGAAR
jgi:hypothetical protein